MNAQTIFHEALTRPSPPERAAYLDAACAGLPELRAVVEALLAAHAQPAEVPDRPWAELSEVASLDLKSAGPEATHADSGLTPAHQLALIGLAGGESSSVLRALGPKLGSVPRMVLFDQAAASARGSPLSRPTEPAAGPGDGRYRLHGEIARGGMGAIVKVRDTELGRDLVIKVLLDDHKDNPEIVRRFIEEAQINGQLQHPGIVPVHDLGRLGDGRPFFSMKLIKGQTLALLLKARTDPSEGRSRFLGIFHQICQTLAYAHSRGVIHRDLKPANVMVGAFGEVQVMDWGLAKLLGAGVQDDHTKEQAEECEKSVIRTAPQAGWDDPSDSDMRTQSGSVLGTPAYMAPEQARGEVELVDERSDVFGLGAILCEVLTGLPPYGGKGSNEVFYLSRRGQLEECYHRLDACGAEPELIELARQCLASNRDLRPRDAGVVADRLSSYLASVDLRLRAAEIARAAEAARAEEALLTVAEAQAKARAERHARRLQLSLAVVAVTLTTIAGIVAAWIARSEQRLASEQTRNARSLRAEQERTATALVRSQELAATMVLERGLVMCERSDSSRGLLWLARSLDLMPPTSGGLERLVRLNIDAWSRQMPLLHAMVPVEGPVAAEAFSPDGRTVILVGNDGIARRFDADTGQPIAELFQHPGPVVANFTPGGDIVVVMTGASGDYRLWNSVTGQALGPVVAGAGPAIGCSLSPDGTRFTVTDPKHTVSIRDAATGRAIGRPMPHSDIVNRVAWSPDSSWIVTPCMDRAARVWNAATGDLIGEPIRLEHEITSVAVSPDGATIATGSYDGVVRFWHGATRQPSGPPLAISSRLRSLQFSPDGRWLATGTIDDQIRLWDATTHTLFGCPLPQHRPANAWVFHTGRALLLTRSGASEVKIWDLSGQLGPQVIRRMKHPVPVRDAAFDTGARKLLAGGGTRYPNAGEARVYHVISGQDSENSLRHDFEIYATAFSPDNRVALTGAGLFAGSDARRRGDLRRWDPVTGRLLGTPIQTTGMVMAVALSRDGRQMLAGCSDGAAHLFDAATGEQLGQPLLHQAPVLAVAFSPDGQRAATGCRDLTAWLWDLSTRKPIGSPLSHGNQVVKVVFSPDGKWLATGCMDDTARLWEATTGRPVGRPMNHGQEVSALVFSADSTLVVSGSDDRSVRFWDRTTGRPVGPALRHAYGIFDVAFAHDGQTVRSACASMAGEIEVTSTRIPVPKPGNRENIRHWCEAVTGLELDETDALRILDAEEWRGRARRLAD